MKSDRRGRTRVAIAASTLVAAGLAAGLSSQVGVPLAGASTPHRSLVAYGKIVPVCKPAKPGHAMCFALRLVRTSKLTPGAIAYRLAGGATDSGTTGPAGGLTPADLASAYGFTSTSSKGATQTVAIIDWGNDPTIASDLTTFDTNYGLATCSTTNGCLNILNQEGETSPLPTDLGTALEIALDVDTVHSVCQECKIDLIEVNSGSLADTGAGVNEAVKLGATEVSNSYGAADSGGISKSIADDYNHPGVVITASSGDAGFYGFDNWINTPSGGPAANPSAPAFPAELQTVVAVGGTTLLLNQNGTRQSESVWNENGIKDQTERLVDEPLGASGGGCSLFFLAAPWQTHLSDWRQTGCGTKRLAADVAADADPYTGFDIYDTSDGGSGWATVGGTSLSAPLIAGMFALAGGAHIIKYPALTLYAHLGGSSLYDITSGGSGFCGGEGAPTCGDPNNESYNGVALGVLDCDYTSANVVNVGDLACDAGPGYDGPSGVGSPIGLGAFVRVNPAVKVSGTTTPISGVSSTWTATATDPYPGGRITSFTWTWGDGSPDTVTTTASAAHTFSVSGTYTITLKVTDNFGVTGSTTYKVTAS